MTYFRIGDIVSDGYSPGASLTLSYVVIRVDPIEVCTLVSATRYLAPQVKDGVFWPNKKQSLAGRRRVNVAYLRQSGYVWGGSIPGIDYEPDSNRWG